MLTGLKKQRPTFMGKKPTAKQRKAVNLMLANLGADVPRPEKEIIKEAGYGPGIQKNPKMVTESKGFLALIDERMPDDLLAKVHLEGLQATKPIPDGEGFWPDYKVREGYLDKAYRLKSKYPQENNPQGVLNISQLLILINGRPKETGGQDVEGK